MTVDASDTLTFGGSGFAFLVAVAESSPAVGWISLGVAGFGLGMKVLDARRARLGAKLREAESEIVRLKADQITLLERLEDTEATLRRKVHDLRDEMQPVAIKADLANLKADSAEIKVERLKGALHDQGLKSGTDIDIPTVQPASGVEPEGDTGEFGAAKGGGTGRD